MKVLIFFLFVVMFFAVLLPDTFAHQSGCHRWHSCPSDSGSYVCGDLGYYSQCPSYYYPKSEPKIEEPPPTISKKIPDSIKSTVFWWATENASDSEFISSLVYLIQNDILDVQQELQVIKNKFELPKYREMFTIPIQGTVEEFGSGYLVNIEIENPEGEISKMNFPVVDLHGDNSGIGKYSGSVIITHDFAVGTYFITGTYKGQEITPTQFTIVSEYHPIPDWVKTIAKWWTQNLISDDDFLSGIKYLITNNIIKS